MILLSWPTLAHHVIGAPKFILNEDSDSPVGMQIEMQVGDYLINSMLVPAFPKIEEPAKFNVFVTYLSDGSPMQSDIKFSIIEKNWMGEEYNEENLGVQLSDNGLFRQDVVIKREGKYLIRAHFKQNNIPYTIDFPVQVGEGTPFLPLLIALFIIVGLMLGIFIFKRVQIIKSTPPE